MPTFGAECVPFKIDYLKREFPSEAYCIFEAATQLLLRESEIY